jgi:hypothetical protein
MGASRCYGIDNAGAVLLLFLVAFGLAFFILGFGWLLFVALFAVLTFTHNLSPCLCHSATYYLENGRAEKSGFLQNPDFYKLSGALLALLFVDLLAIGTDNPPDIADGLPNHITGFGIFGIGVERHAVHRFSLSISFDNHNKW